MYFPICIFLNTIPPLPKKKEQLSSVRYGWITQDMMFGRRHSGHEPWAMSGSEPSSLTVLCSSPERENSDGPEAGESIEWCVWVWTAPESPPHPKEDTVSSWCYRAQLLPHQTNTLRLDLQHWTQLSSKRSPSHFSGVWGSPGTFSFLTSFYVSQKANVAGKQELQIPFQRWGNWAKERRVAWSRHWLVQNGGS